MSKTIDIKSRLYRWKYSGAFQEHANPNGEHTEYLSLEEHTALLQEERARTEKEFARLNSHIDFIEQELKDKERDLDRWEEMLGVLAGKMGIDISGCYDMGDTIGQIDAWYDEARAARSPCDAEKKEEVCR